MRKQHENEQLAHVGVKFKRVGISNYERKDCYVEFKNVNDEKI
jgi:hypothetical protein